MLFCKIPIFEYFLYNCDARCKIEVSLSASVLLKHNNTLFQGESSSSLFITYRTLVSTDARISRG